MSDVKTSGHETPCPLGGCPMVNVMRSHWSPYVAGAGIGIMSWLVFALVDKPIGMSTAIAATSGAILMPAIGEEAVRANAYWAKEGPGWNYGTLFLVGTFLGAFLSAAFSRDLRFRLVSPTWAERFGPSPWKRAAVAFVGGFIVLYGARLAGGCTSGHGISGTLQLAVSSWLFFAVMFAVGVATALALFRRRAEGAQP